MNIDRRPFAQSRVAKALVGLMNGPRKDENVKRNLPLLMIADHHDCFRLSNNSPQDLLLNLLPLSESSTAVDPLSCLSMLRLTSKII